MKHKAKNILIGLVVGVTIAVAGSMYAAMRIDTTNPSNSGVIVVPEEQPTPEPVMKKEVVQQIKKVETKTTITIDPTEARLRAIEARLTKLEQSK